MTDLRPLKTLLDQVVYHKHYDGLEGLSPVQFLLAKDQEGEAVRFLNEQLPTLPDKIRGGIAFALASHYLETGSLQAIRDLFVRADVEIQAAVLNGLWGEPNAGAEMGAGIVALAVEGMRHPAAQIRVQSAFVILNQSAWRVDVTVALAPLLRLLDDPVPQVRRQASYAAGSVAKRKYDLAAFLPPLIGNLRHEDMFVREPSAWALWQFSRRYDLTPAVADLVYLLTSEEDFDQLRKSAVGALLHYARKSTHNRDIVLQQAALTPLSVEVKEIARFLQQLAEIH